MFPLWLIFLATFAAAAQSQHGKVPDPCETMRANVSRGAEVPAYCQPQPQEEKKP